MHTHANQMYYSLILVSLSTDNLADDKWSAADDDDSTMLVDTPPMSDQGILDGSISLSDVLECGSSSMKSGSSGKL